MSTEDELANAEYRLKQAEQWIAELRSRTHQTGNHAQSVQGEVALERLRLDELLRQQGRDQVLLDSVQAWQNRMIGAVTVLAFLFPTTVGVILKFN